MADKRPAHRKGTTGRDYRRLQANVYKGNICARCGNTRGPIIRDAPCHHPTHQDLRGCPTHTLAPSLGHKIDLQYGGRPRDKNNVQLEHFGCNASAGVKTRTGRRGAPRRDSWNW